MTPTSIRTGRDLSYQSRTQTLAQGSAVALIEGDSNRVGLALALSWAAAATLSDVGVFVGVLRAGALVPLTCLTPQHPACWLDVLHLSGAICEPLSVQSVGADNLTLGVTAVRQIRELEQ